MDEQQAAMIIAAIAVRSIMVIVDCVRFRGLFIQSWVDETIYELIGEKARVCFWEK